MYTKLKKWLCPKCGLDWWSPEMKWFFQCLECGTYCDQIPNIWNVGEELEY